MTTALLDPEADDLSLAHRLVASGAWRDAVRGMTETQATALRYDWRFWRRPSQTPPPGEWDVWMLRAGRGSGKTRTGAEEVRERVEQGARRIALVAPTGADARDVMVEGESGLLSVFPPSKRPNYEPSKRRVTFHTGAIATTYSAEEPDRLRGPQHDFVWADELSSWKRGPETLDNLLLGLRLGEHPQLIITTTPKRLRWLMDLEADPGTVVTTASTFANIAHLAPTFIRQVIGRYEGTRLGEQELHAAYLLDVEGALWNYDLLDTNRLALEVNDDGMLQLPAPIRDVVVSIDPPASSTGDECGIVIAARDVFGVGYVLEDRSRQATPAEWGRTAWDAAIDWGADRFVVEDNQGGDMVVTVLNAARPDPELDDDGNVTWEPPTVRVQRARARTSKWQRAEAIAALTERGRVRMVGTHPELEDQLTSWTTDDSDSPDRLDAFVWAMRSLLVEDRKKVRIIA